MATPVPSPPADAVQPPELGLFGRELDLAKVTQLLLAPTRLVTVVGPGGVGKTRLATAVIAGWGHGPVCACELAPLPDSSGVPDAIAESLGFPTIEAVALGWSGQGLIAIDNAEHHLDAVALSVAALLPDCPGLSILVTSREPLVLPDERVVVLEPLAVTDGNDPRELAASPAVQLFLARAGALGVRFDDEALPVVADIVRKLDGLPLAIELAAARARGLGLNDILRHLDARFELLTRRHDRGPIRHRSLEATIGWSYDRLEPALQRFFARLGAFCGPFTVEAAMGVAAPDEPVATTLDRLDALVTRSLINADDRDGQTVYVLPESVRLYARRRLDEQDEAEICDVRCVDHYVGAAASLAADAAQRWSSDVFGTLASSNLNLRDALRWCLRNDADPTRATTLLLPLWGLVHNGRADIVREFGELMLERWPEPRDQLWSIAAAVTGTAMLADGEVQRGADLADRALAIAGGGMGAVIAARARYLVAVHQGDGAAALGWLDRLAAAATAQGAEPFGLESQLFRAATLAQVGEPDAARRTAIEARRRATASDSDLLLVFGEVTLGAVVSPDHPAEGRRALDRAIALGQRIDYPWGVGVAHRIRGALAFVDGDLATAAAALGRSLDTFLQVGQLGEVAGTLRWVAGVLAAAGQSGPAAGLLLPIAPSPPLLAAAERDHLEPLLAGLPGVDAALTDGSVSTLAQLRSTIAGARAALEGLVAGAATQGSAGAGGGATEGVGPAHPSDAAATAGVSVEDATLVANRWIRDGAIWELTFAGRTVRLPHAKGLEDLATLLDRPGREVAATELMGGAVDSDDVGPVIDATARSAYEERIRELHEDLEEAEAFGDLRRVEAARGELDQLIDALTAATGLGGRTRRVGGTDERARSAVTRRIRDAMRRVAQGHPPLGEHLAAAVRTGRWCTYAPTEPREWVVVSRP